MKRRYFLPLLALEAALCVLLGLLGRGLDSNFFSIQAFPFAQLGQGLRSLSALGRWGNAGAIFLYLLVGLLPLGLLLWLGRKKRLRAEDGLLAIETFLLFAGLYKMINPAAAPAEQVSGCWGTAIYSVLLAWAVLRLLRGFYRADREQLQGYGVILLELLAAVFLFAGLWGGISGFADSLASLRAANTGSGEAALALTELFLALRAAGEAVPLLFDTAAAVFALRLLEELGRDRYSEAVQQAAERLSRLCGVSLAVSLLLTVGLNLAQALLLDRLYDVGVSLYLPLYALAFLLLVLLFTRYLGENRQLKEENDLFV